MLSCFLHILYTKKTRGFQKLTTLKFDSFFEKNVFLELLGPVFLCLTFNKEACKLCTCFADDPFKITNLFFVAPKKTRKSVEHRVFWTHFSNEIRPYPKRAVEFKASEFLKKSVFLGDTPSLKPRNFEISPHLPDAFSHVKIFHKGIPTRDPKNGPILKIRNGKNEGIFVIFRVFSKK